MIKRILKATILLIMLLPVSLPATMDFIFEESLSQSLARVETLYSSGKWDEAMNVGRGIIKDSPQNHPAARRAQDLIILSIDGRNKELLANEKRQKQKNNIDNAQQLITEGSKLLGDKDYSGAAAKFGRATQLNGGDAQHQFLLGYASLKAGKQREAYRALQRCLKLDSQHERALFHIAGLSYELNQGKEAEDYSAKLIEIIEKKLEELKGIFIAQRSEGLNDKAMVTARRTAALRNNLAQAYHMYGVLTHRRKEYRAAAKSFESATRLNPAMAENWFYLGSSFLHLKVYHQATLALEQAVLIKETRLRDLATDAGKLLDAGKSDEAVKAELETRKLKDETVRMLYLLAIANGKKKETNEAISNIERALELKPDFIEGRYTRAILLAEKNYLEEALEQMRQVLKDCPPKSAQAKKAINTITLFMDLIAKRDNPQEFAMVGAPTKTIKVDQYVKDMPGLGGKKAEINLEQVFERMRDVKNLISVRNYAEAVRRLLYLRTQHSDIADIHAALGHCYMEMGRINDAEPCFEQAIQLNPRHAEALNNLAYVLATRVEKLDKALEYANRALAEDDMRAEFHHSKGWVLFKTGEVAKSIACFHKALEIKPNYQLARYNSGLASYIAQDFAAAVEAFNSVLALDPTHDKAMLFKAISLTRINKAEEAIATLETLRGKLDGKSVLGRVVTDLHARLKLAHERNDELPVPHIKSPAPIERLMAEAAEYRKKGLVNHAKEKYLECLRLAPERFEPHFKLGEMYAASGLNVPALSAWERAEKLNADYFPLQLNMGKMHQKLGRPAKAREYFTRAQALREKDPEPRYYLGLIAYEEQKFESAESHALAALRLKPDFYKSMALLGMARIRLNRLRPARDIYETLYAKAPTDSSIRQHARKKIWELTRMMAPSQFPSVENALEVKEQMVKKARGDNGAVKISRKASDEVAIAEYGKNTMTVDDKMWVLGQLEKFGKISTPTPVAPLRREVTAQTMSNREKQWMVRKLQGFGAHSNKYALPPEMKAQKYSLKTTEKESTRPSDKSDDLVRAALAFAEKGFINEAVIELEKARSLSPDNLETLLNLGFIHTIQGNFKSAFDVYAQATVSHPREPLAHLALGNLYWLGGQAEEAVKEWKKIRGRFKPDQELNILPRSGQIWRRMLEIDPVDPDSHSNLGLVYLFSGELNRALAEFQAVTQIDANRREHEFYQAQVLVLLYLNKSNSNHRREADKILAGLSKGDEPFPHTARLQTFVKNL